MVTNDLPVESHPVNTPHQRPSISNRRVGYEEFCSLAVSAHRRLLRSNDPAAGLCGLLDPDTGERFVIAERELSLRED